MSQAPYHWSHQMLHQVLMWGLAGLVLASIISQGFHLCEDFRLRDHADKIKRKKWDLRYKISIYELHQQTSI